MNQINVAFKKWNLLVWLNGQAADARVAVKPICEAIGISWQGQHEKIKGDPKFSCQDILMTGTDGKQYQMVTLPVAEVQGWLFSINSRKVSAEAAPLLLEFQKGLFDVIYAATSGQVSREVMNDLLSRMDCALAQIAFLTEWVMELSRENAELRKMIVEPINTSISNAARTLRTGHLKN